VRHELFRRSLHWCVFCHSTWICTEGRIKRELNLIQSSRRKRGLSLLRNSAMTAPPRSSAVNCYCMPASEQVRWEEYRTQVQFYYTSSSWDPPPPNFHSSVDDMIHPAAGWLRCMYIEHLKWVSISADGYKMSSYIYFSGGWLWEIL
jgi:hypothetical protein